ncbi:TPA: restriction endonuclease subunit S [Mannheimia haemolytica]
MTEIEQEFLDSGGVWEKFRLGNLFSSFSAIKQAKSQGAIPTDNSENGVNYVVQSMYNNMVARRVNKQYLIENNEPPVSGNKIVLGVTLPAVSYQEKEFGASQVITATSEWLNKNNGIYIATLISKEMYQFSYSKKPGLQIYKDMEIEFPSINGNLALSFMENFIAELKALRVAELKALRVAELHAYLQATGLSNYTLSDDEQAALNAIKTAKWQIFNVEDLFGKATRGKRLKSADRISGDLPFVTAGETDTGISAFIGNDVERFKPNTITIDMFGSAKYRNYEYGADDHIAVVHTDKLPKYSVLFLTSAIHKVANAGQFSYARNFYAKDADALNIELPVKNGKPDVELMENYLQAIEKLVIKDVVQWADKQIEATEEVILN